MTFEADLVAHLLADAAVTALVGDRIWPDQRFEPADLPAITYLIVVDSPETSLDGFTSGLSNIRVQIDAWSTTPDERTAIGLAVRNRMYVDAATFKVASSSGQDFFEDDTRLFRRSQDFSTWFSE